MYLMLVLREDVKHVKVSYRVRYLTEYLVSSEAESTTDRLSLSLLFIRLQCRYHVASLFFEADSTP